jgi:hypothetical protein
VGRIEVYTTTLSVGPQSVRTFYETPEARWALTIVAVNGGRMMLRYADGGTIEFDLVSRTWLPAGSPAATPAPSPSPTPTPSAGGGFPATGVLDSFNRGDGPVGANWTGNASGYSIAGNAPADNGGNASTLPWNTAFGPDQEVYAMPGSINADASEIDLVLKAQDNGECNLLEVWYQPSHGTGQVWTANH